LLRAMHWMAVYEDGDPKVPPQENILAWKRELERQGIPVLTRVVVNARSHTGPRLLPECMTGLLRFLTNNR
jgi:hypothetical protein